MLVVQVAGTGGTFPIEVAPGFFRGLSAASVYAQYGGYERGCWWCVWYGLLMDLGKLGVFLIVSLVVGLVLRRPIIRMNDGFTEKLEETKLI